MLLAVDVGNTQTHLGIFEPGEPGRLVDHWRYATHVEDTADEIAARLAALLDLGGLGLAAVEAAVICSVVPRASIEYERLCRRYLGREALFVAPGIRTGMPIRLDNPHELGGDRLVNAIAAYDAVRGPCAVVDFGTAITIDAVSPAGEYLGGVIAPGVQVSMEALSRRAARLPNVDFAEPGAAIGTTTAASLRSGMVLGFAGAVDAIADRVREELGGAARFIATGGMASQIMPHCRSIDELDELLTLRGLRLVHGLNS